MAELRSFRMSAAEWLYRKYVEQQGKNAYTAEGDCVIHRMGYRMSLCHPYRWSSQNLKF